MSPKPNILIDARLYGSKHTGIGRYTKNLLLAMSKLPDFTKYNFSVLVTDYHPELIDYKQIDIEIPHYSRQEQTHLPQIIRKLKPDLVHFTHFNKPINYCGKSVVTIHDLIKHFFKGKDTTTKNALLYWPKYWLYLLVTYINIKNNYLITPSNFWRNYIIKHFHKNPKNIITTYEAIDPVFIKNLDINNYELNKNYKLKIENYIVYTGNLYPHKNVDVIIKALEYLPKIKLKIICNQSYFLDKYKKKYENNPQIEFLINIADNEFKDIYPQAICLVHPSLMEGFSLTGLEAMALNCPVVSSNLSCLPEIYGNSVLYFNPHDPKDLADKIQSLDKNKRQELIKKGQKQIKKYSWTKTAQQTLDYYEKILKS